MKKIILILIAVLLVFLGTSLLLKNMSQRRMITELVDRKGEGVLTLHYRVYMLGLFPVGEAWIKKESQEDYEGRKVYHINGLARTNRFFSAFFSGEAEVDSLVDIASINPVIFRQRIYVKNKYDLKKEASYDQDKGVMTSGGVSRVIPPDTKDPLSAFLYLKRMSSGMLKDFEININTNQKTYILKGVSEIKEAVLGKNRFELARLNAQIMRRDKNPYHRSNISMLLVRVKENIPVKISVFSGGFFVQALLTDIN